MVNVNSGSACVSGVDAPLGKRLLAGVIGGLVGGLVFGMMMWKMGMLSMIASMMGSGSVWLGFLIHMMISVVFGLGAGYLVRWIPTCPGFTIMAAGAYGVFLWMVGPLVMMPLMMGGKLFAITPASSASLMGHVVYAVIAVFVARFAAKRLTNA